MVKPSVVTVNPYSIEYPLWRFEMEKHKAQFDSIFNIFYQDSRKYDFKDFIMGNTPWATSLDAGFVTHGDWRNFSISPRLKMVKSDWTLFLEQDFVATDAFWEKILTDAENYDVIGFTDVGNVGGFSGMDGTHGWKYGVRLHPAFILVRTPLIFKTRMDFGAHPENGRDHFGTFTDDLIEQDVRYLNLYTYEGWKHYAGVYSNYMLVQEGKKPNFKPDEFKEYVKKAMDAPVTQDPRFIAWSKDCLAS